MVENHFFQSLAYCVIHEKNNYQDWFCKRKVFFKKLRWKNPREGQICPFPRSTRVNIPVHSQSASTPFSLCSSVLLDFESIPYHLSFILVNLNNQTSQHSNLWGLCRQCYINLNYPYLYLIQAIKGTRYLPSLQIQFQ